MFLQDKIRATRSLSRTGNKSADSKSDSQIIELQGGCGCFSHDLQSLVCFINVLALLINNIGGDTALWEMRELYGAYASVSFVQI